MSTGSDQQGGPGRVRLVVVGTFMAIAGLVAWVRGRKHRAGGREGAAGEAPAG